VTRSSCPNCTGTKRRRLPKLRKKSIGKGKRKHVNAGRAKNAQKEEAFRVGAILGRGRARVKAEGQTVVLGRRSDRQRLFITAHEALRRIKKAMERLGIIKKKKTGSKVEARRGTENKLE